MWADKVDMSLPYTEIDGTSTAVQLAGDDFFKPWVRIEELRSRRLRRPVVLVNGAFDILHSGHMALLSVARDAASKGTVIAAIDSDAKIKASKGPSRPVFNFFHRAKAVSFMPVDYIVEIDGNEDFFSLCGIVQPDIRVLGDEYKDVLSRIPHVRTIYVERIPGGMSTSEIIRRCKNVV